jgi:hypothetical protein
MKLQESKQKIQRKRNERKREHSVSDTDSGRYEHQAEETENDTCPGKGRASR